MTLALAKGVKQYTKVEFVCEIAQRGEKIVNYTRREILIPHAQKRRF